MKSSGKQTQSGLTWTIEPSRLTAESFGRPALEIEMDCKMGFYEGGKWRKTPVRALWDTGSSITVVTPRVAEELKLPKVNAEFTLNAVNNQSKSELRVAWAVLPNGKAFGPIHVAVQNLPTVDVLLGMDVISSGTFVIERKPDGGTRFTFLLNL